MESVRQDANSITYIHNPYETVLLEYLNSKEFDPYLFHEEWLEGKSDELKLLYE